jgi:hypothetical protein|eukprot:COSAG01_NODE_2108_length_8408_cov_138.235768_8_plen_274_part_00
MCPAGGGRPAEPAAGAVMAGLLLVPLAAALFAQSGGAPAQLITSGHHPTSGGREEPRSVVVGQETARTQVFLAGRYCTVAPTGPCAVVPGISYDRHDIFGDSDPYNPAVVGLYNRCELNCPLIIITAPCRECRARGASVLADLCWCSCKFRTKDHSGSQCCGWCSGYANCTAWSICAGCRAPFTDVCFLKTSTAGKTSHPGAISGLRAGTRPPAPPQPSDESNCIPWSLDPHNKNGTGFYWSANTCSMLLSSNDTLIACAQPLSLACSLAAPG